MPATLMPMTPVHQRRPPDEVTIVGLGGTTRDASSSERALRYALGTAAGAGARTRLFVGGELAELPLYRPEEPARTDVAQSLVTALRQADGVIISSPGYHGSISGLVKNALDYIEDLRDDPRPYLQDRAVGCIAAGLGVQALITTIGALRDVVHALRGWPTPLAAAIQTNSPVFDAEGRPLDERAAYQLSCIGCDVVRFAAAWRHACPAAIAHPV